MKKNVSILRYLYHKYMGNTEWHLHHCHDHVTPNIVEAFLYHSSIGFSPLNVLVSSVYAHRSRNSFWLMTRVSLPVMAEYMSSTTLKSLGKKMSKKPCWTCPTER